MAEPEVARSAGERRQKRARFEVRRAAALCLAAFILVGIGPFVLGQYSVDILIRSFLFGAIAVSLDILWGYTGILSFGQSAFFAIGAYAAGLAFAHIGLTPLTAIGALIAGVVVAGLVGALTGWLAFGYGVSEFYIAIATLVLSVVVVQILYSGGTFTGSSSGLSGFATFDLSMSAWFWIAGAALVVVTAFGWIFVRSDAGKLLVAIRENEQRCKYFGLATNRIKTALIAGSAVVAALAGYAYAAYTDVVAPELGGFQFGTELVIWVALGGRGTLVGPAIAAVVIDFVSAYLGGTLPFVWQLLVGVVFIVVIVALPEGLGPAAFHVVRRLLGWRGGAATARGGAIALAPTRPFGEGDSAAIELRGIACRYGSLSVLQGISFVGRPGELVGLVGPNGAGKTTLIRCISDGKERSAGRVALGGRGIGRMAPEYCARLGLGRKFQAPNVFDTLSVAESLRIARARIERPSFWRSDATVGLPDAALQVVRATGLADQLSVTGKHLSHGSKQALELAMVLATEPRVLLLDEPTAGLTKAERALIGSVLVTLTRQYKLCILLIEHDLEFVREISSRIIVLHQGRIALDGNVEEVVSSELVRTIYVGEPDPVAGTST